LILALATVVNGDRFARLNIQHTLFGQSLWQISNNPADSHYETADPRKTRHMRLTSRAANSIPSDSTSAMLRRANFSDVVLQGSVYRRIFSIITTCSAPRESGFKTKRPAAGKQVQTSFPYSVVPAN